MLKRSHRSGMTLLELTVVILVLLSLISILFIASRAWKAGTDRSTCIMHIEMVQKSVRGYSNMYNQDPGTTVTDLMGKIIGYGCFVETEPTCPADGDYVFGEDFGVDTIPPVGTLYMKCSLASTHGHEPVDYSTW